MKEKMNEKLMLNLVSVVEEEIDITCTFMYSHGLLWQNIKIVWTLIKWNTMS